MADIAHPPETLEGWYSLHQVFQVDRAAVRALAPETLTQERELVSHALAELANPIEGGWSIPVALIGSRADLMLVHFRPTLESLSDAQHRLGHLRLMESLRVTTSHLGVTEAGMYHLTAELARAAETRGGALGDEPYRAELSERLERERASEHVRRRLYPPLPVDMPYVCFYPMSKRRNPDANWYTLPLSERSQLMMAHGQVGRRYAGRVQQMITGAIGFDQWEWGVTLFAREPLDFKKLVTEMRFDHASAVYAEFGEFWVGKMVGAGEWLGMLG
ncbi:MAG TPA: hydrogen peroxide-dependent heme synthase [Gemmatimonadaceae bacterium]|nr:hydrogen peroxide-dependent heme synthase [Gemmatimonadaceae bacterium]